MLSTTCLGKLRFKNWESTCTSMLWVPLHVTAQQFQTTKQKPELMVGPVTWQQMRVSPELLTSALLTCASQSWALTSLPQKVFR